MRSFFKHCGIYALGAACLAGTAQAQDYRLPSVLPSATAQAAYAPRFASMGSVLAPSNPEGPAITEPLPPVYGEMAAPQTIPGAYGHYGNQAPGMGPALASPPAPEYPKSVIYGDGDLIGGKISGEHGCSEGDLGCYDCATQCRSSCWFGSVRGLIMTLGDEEAHWFSYDDINLERQILNTKDARMDWSGGVEARIGRWFNCCQNGLELVYWGIYPEKQEANRTANDVQGTLNHVFTFNSLTYDDGLGNGPVAVDSFFNNAQRHRLQRDWSIHNVELNLLTLRNLYGPDGYGMCAGCGPSFGALGSHCGPRLNVSWIAGFRFFRFDESFLFSSDPTDMVFDGSPDELHYGVSVDNELYGFQLGADTEFFLTRRVSLRTTAKFGIYNNHMEQKQRVGGSEGAACARVSCQEAEGRGAACCDGVACCR